jgi:glycosyltransferase involved in cell wall biosynthesis
MYDHVVITSQRDKEAMEALGRRYLPPDASVAAIDVVTNGVDLTHFCPNQDPAGRDEKTVVFTGKMSYHANVSAALYFTEKVLPLIWARDPGVIFQVVGKDPPEVVQKLSADKRIQVTGYVDRLPPYLSRSTVAVCPVPYAVGVQNKVLEAMATATPVVCTSAAFSGLDAEQGKDIMVADDPDEFADRVLEICSDPALALRLGTAGRRYVADHHSWEASVRRLVEAYEKARHRHRAGS